MLPDGEDKAKGLSGEPIAAPGSQLRPLTDTGLASLVDVAPRPRVVLAYLVAVVGGVVGIPAAAIQESQGYSGLWLGAIIIAPLVEEVVKPVGVMYIMEKRFHWLRSGRQVVVMAALGAVVFATLENLMYIHVYHPDPSTAYMAWRYMVCTSLHVAASVIFGLGLARTWRRMRRTGGRFRIKGLLWPYLAAAGLHAAYNTTVMILQKTGVLSLD
jgi:RsiW-degrading membrane proteinase PrsW (M82 family)